MSLFWDAIGLLAIIGMEAIFFGGALYGFRDYFRDGFGRKARRFKDTAQLIFGIVCTIVGIVFALIFLELALHW